MANPGTKRFVELDGIRGFGALVVVLFHYVHLITRQSPPSPLKHAADYLGWTIGIMDLFFILSGFLIAGVLYDARLKPNYFKTFYLRRLLRIFPLYYAVVGLFLIARLVAWAGGLEALHWLIQRPVSTLNATDGRWFISYWLYLQNFAMAYAGEYGAYWLSPTWSLAVEEQFYLGLPLLIRYVPARWLRGVVLGFIMAAPILRFGLALTPYGNATAQYVLTPLRFDALGFGVLTALLYRDASAWDWLTRQRPWWWTMLAVTSGWLFLLYSRRLSFYAPAQVATFYFAQAVAYTMLFWLVLTRQSGRLAGFFRWSWFVWVGEFSYGLYLMHVPVLGLAHAVVFGGPPNLETLPRILVTSAAAVVVIWLAKLSWEYFEKPFIRRGQRFRYDAA
ncbi:MAG: acyltransferase [Chloracidobacterium sp.]|uniref:Acyltransferase n=1 Tax=Chloracidobacterium validum TaxID=2821543 RepID=A0ABX8B931_9BACT|nr:acyltransferase [Chloracidobacterium validum]QUW03447.1 acyltransferase [Chloracidobacterium validum]